MLLCWRSRASRAARSVLPLSPNSFSNTARGLYSIGSGCVALRHEMRVRVGATEVAGARAGVGRRIHRELERGELRLPGELPRQQLVHRDVGDDLDLVAPAARRAGQERSGGARVDVVPVRLEARQDEHLIAERRQRLEDGRQLEGRAFALRRPVLHRHPVRHIEGLEAMRRLRRSPGRAARTRAPSTRGTAAPSVAPSPRRTVRRGSDFAVMNAMAVGSF